MSTGGRASSLEAAVAHLRRSDAALARLIDAVGPCRFAVDKGGGAFATLAEAIVYQQIAGSAAEAIMRRFRAVVGRRHPRPRDVLAARPRDLRAAGLSRAKALYVRDLAQRASDGLPLRRLGRLPDEEVVKALTEVKGIGRWTAEMFLMFRLGRLDVLPVGDYGVQKAMQRLYARRRPPTAEWMSRTAEPWRPFRTIACWYLWRSVDGAPRIVGGNSPR
jgi:3-methyladenine DNA glycosylase/8-oxoguanine DNA glycosylase